MADYIMYCWKNGVIEIEESCPDGALPLCTGQKNYWRRLERRLADGHGRKKRMTRKFTLSLAYRKQTQTKKGLKQQAFLETGYSCVALPLVNQMPIYLTKKLKSWKGLTLGFR